MIEIPGYKIIRPLGKGGMASVYLAVQKSFGRQVALKVMDDSNLQDPRFTARFLHEAKVVGRLVHPNIVTVHDVGVHGTLHYLAMEYIPGKNLKQLNRSLAPQRSLRVIRDVAGALDFAARKGYVHRDVKPENIMLHADNGRAVLMDFGIACLADKRTGITQAGTAVGTPHYMSPEQARGHPVDVRSDIYSLGVVLYRLLTGRVPYDGDSAVDVGIKHLQEAVPRLPGNLRLLQPIIDKALAKNPDQRFQTAAALASAIGGITEEDIEAIRIATRHYEAQRRGGVRPAASPRKRRAKSPADSSAVAGKMSSPKTLHSPLMKEPAATTGLIESVDNDAIHTSVDDRPERLNLSTRRRWPWLAAAALLFGIAAAGPLRDQLPPEAASALEQVLKISRDLRGAVSSAPLTQDSSAEIQASDEDTAAISEAPPNTADEAIGEGAAQLFPDEEIDRLWARLDQDPSVASRLVEIHRRVPDSEEAERALQKLGNGLHVHTDRALDQRKLAEAQAYLDALAGLSAELEGAGFENDLDFQSLNERLHKMHKAAKLVEEGDALLAANKLTEPRSENAWQNYQRALELDPDNPGALAGLAEIPERYWQLAQTSLESGDSTWAAELARRGLRVDSEHKGLKSIVAPGGASEVDRVRATARRRMAAEHYLTPPGDSALDYFLRLQDLEPDSDEARLGIMRIEREVIHSAETLINRNQFDQARGVLMRAREAFPDNRRFIALEAALERAELAEVGVR